jgi:ribosomal-protein-alanine N-acetyltransferase
VLRHLGDLERYTLHRIEMRRYFPDGIHLEETKEELEWHQHGHPRHPELGLWATVERETGKFLGRCGLLPWTIDGAQEVELAYLIAKERWGQGYATEAAHGIVRYAREQLGLTRLICLITHGNVAHHGSPRKSA